MKIGIVGLGSIGRRHSKILLSKGISVSALRTNQGTLQELSTDLLGITQYTDSKAFYAQNLDGVIICNPTSHHFKSTVAALDNCSAIFVEKPFVNTLAEAKLIPENAQSKIVVAFCLRAHKIVDKLKGIVVDGSLGKVLKGEFYVGQYLPDWHPYADYSTEYYAKKSLGGGALRTLSHEIDLATYLMDDLKKVYAKTAQLSSLEINVEDSVYMIGEHIGGALSNISIDFLSMPGRRDGQLTFEKGIVRYDFVLNEISITKYGEEKQTVKVDSHDMYEHQMDEFIGFINKKETFLCDYNSALHNMSIIDGAERSSVSQKNEIVI